MTSCRRWPTRLRTAVLLSTVAIATLPAAGALAADAGVPPLMITPTGAGSQDGSSWADAARLSALPRLVLQRPDGGEVLVRSDLGPYKITGPITLAHGGQPGRPVVVRGVDGAGRPAAPTIVGTRAAPYSATGAAGTDAFRLLEGADHLAFRDLSFMNHGNGAIRVGGDIADLEIEDVTATNVGRFLEDYVSGGATTASVDGLVMRRVTVDGFSRSVARLRYSSRNVLLEDVAGDSQRQESADIPMGVHLEGSVSDVVLRRVRMDNTSSRVDAYWNGDGFATERGVTRVRFEDTSASGHTDAGYDLKSTATTLVRTSASGNKRNYRFWADDITAQDCAATAPVRRGGSGTQDQVWVAEAGGAVMTGCRFTDASPDSTVFQLEARASLTVRGGSVTRSPLSRLQVLRDGSRLDLDLAWAPAAPSTAPTPVPSTSPSAAPLQRSATCPGYEHDTRRQIVGTAGPDTLVGTSAGEVLCGLDGDDTIVGGGGDDLVLGGAGRDVLDGAAGYDVVRGGLDDDRLNGGADRDTLLGDEGSDVLLGGAQRDQLDGGDGNDQLSGGDYNDRLVGGAGDDQLLGDGGDDVLDGGPGYDELRGGQGHDSLTGGAGRDRLHGDLGNDVLLGGDHRDTLDGGDGGDELRGGDYNDSLTGGSGDDRLFGDGGEDRLDGGAGTNTLDGGSSSDVCLVGSGGTVTGCP